MDYPDQEYSTMRNREGLSTRAKAGILFAAVACPWLIAGEVVSVATGVTPIEAAQSVSSSVANTVRSLDSRRNAMSPICDQNAPG